jgi:hypothetical protein
MRKGLPKSTGFLVLSFLLLDYLTAQAAFFDLNEPGTDEIPAAATVDAEEVEHLADPAKPTA